MNASNIVALWVMREGIVPYKKEQHAEIAKKFLFWPNDGDGSPLMIVGADDLEDMEGLSHTGLVARLRKNGHPVPSVNALGAGDCSGGMISFWQSVGFCIKTPDVFKPIIKELLGCEEYVPKEEDLP